MSGEDERAEEKPEEQAEVEGEAVEGEAADDALVASLGRAAAAAEAARGVAWLARGGAALARSRVVGRSTQVERGSWVRSATGSTGATERRGRPSPGPPLLAAPSCRRLGLGLGLGMGLGLGLGLG